MLTINRKITPYNFTKNNNKHNDWLVIHYVGAVSSAKNNAQYFYTAKRGASAHYFVDANEIWQVVEDTDNAWHVGGAKTYYNACRNNNSIGIEMCCFKDDFGTWYFEPQTVQNTIELARELIKKYGISRGHVVRHYDVTHKICPAPFVNNPDAWQNFLDEVFKEDKEVEELTTQEKCKAIREYYNLDENTTQYFQFYRYNQALIDKLYAKTKNSDK